MLLAYGFSDDDPKMPDLSEMKAVIKNWKNFFDARRPNQGYGGNTIYITRPDYFRKYYTLSVQGVCTNCEWASQVELITEDMPDAQVIYMDQEWTWGDYETRFPEGT